MSHVAIDPKRETRSARIDSAIRILYKFRVTRGAPGLLFPRLLCDGFRAHYHLPSPASSLPLDARTLRSDKYGRKVIEHELSPC